MSDERLKDFLEIAPIHEILSRPEFRGPFDTLLPSKEAKELIEKKYPDFKFEGLDKIQIADMAARCQVIDNESKKVVELVKSGKRQEALKLAREIKIVGDPNISISVTGIGSIVKTVHGNLEMASAFLGFGDLQLGKGWVDFIVRTWGFIPDEIVKI